MTEDAPRRPGMALGINVVPLLTFTLPVIPAFFALLFGLQRFDGYFRDNVIFLFLLGGLGAGGLTSVLGVMLLVSTPFMFAVGMPLVMAGAATAVLNRRKWHGERHSVFNGATFGAGMGIVWGFALGYRTFEAYGMTPRLVAELFLVSTGLVLVFFSVSAFIGSGVADRTPFRVLLLGAIGVLPATVMLNEYVQGGVLVWPVLLTAYGGLAFWLAQTRVLPLGLTVDERRGLRRARRTGS